MLFSFGLDHRPLSRAKAAVLLSFHTSAEQPQGASIWLAEAIQALTAAGIQFNRRVHGEERDLEESTQKRLWWSILLRDRALCLGLRRRPQVLFYELRLMASQPTEKDFESEINGSRVYDRKTKRALFMHFQAQCELSSLLTEIVSVVFMTNGISLPSLTLEGFENALATISKMKTSLMLWKQNSQLPTVENADIHNAVIRFSHSTLMYYQ